MLRDVALRVPVATSKSPAVVGAICRFRDGRGGHYNATNTNITWLMGGRGSSGLWTGTADIPPAVPWLTVRNGMPGVCPAGCVGGQAAQPGSTRTPSPSVQLGAVGWSPHCPARGRRSPRRHRQKGQTVKLRGNPEGQRYRPGVATSQGHHVVAWG